jgi:hypothetical protein
MDAFIGIGIFLMIIALAAVAFTFWVIAVIAKAVICGVGSLFASPARIPSPPLSSPRRAPGPVYQVGATPLPHKLPGGNGNGRDGGAHCDHFGCDATNPPNARFCRRCGRGINQSQGVYVRRAEVW